VDFEALSERTAHFQPCFVFKGNELLTVEMWLKLLDDIDIDNRRTMDSDKFSRVQFLFQFVQPVIDQVTCGFCVQDYIVT
jgi:hypothetical protein